MIVRCACDGTLQQFSLGDDVRSRHSQDEGLRLGTGYNKEVGVQYMQYKEDDEKGRV